MAFRVEALPDERQRTETTAHEKVAYTYFMGNDGLMCEAHHTMLFPEGSPLNQWLLPQETKIEMRHDLANLIGHSFTQVMVNDKISALAGTIQNGYSDVSPGYPMSETVYWVSEHYRQVNIGMFNSAQLPDGTVLIFPWGNGKSPFGETEEQRDVSLTKPFVVGRFTATAPRPLHTPLEVGDVVEGRYDTHVVVQVGTSPLTIRFDRTANFGYVAERITSLWATPEDAESDRVGPLLVTGQLKLVGKATPPVAEHIRPEDIRVGDVVTYMRSRVRSYVCVRWVARDPAVGIRVKGILGDRFPLKAAWDQNVLSTVPTAAMACKLYRLRHDEVPAAWAAVLEGAATQAEWDASGVSLKLQGNDAFDAAKFKSIWTREMLADLNRAGITAVSFTHSTTPLPGDAILPQGSVASYIHAAAAVGNRATCVETVSVGVSLPPGAPRTYGMTEALYVPPGVSAPWCELKDQYSGNLVARFYPETSTLSVERVFQTPSNLSLSYMRNLYGAAAKFAAEMMDAYVNGGLRKKVDRARFSLKLKETFGVDGVPEGGTIVFEGALLKVYEAADTERPDIIIFDRGYKVKKLVRHIGPRFAQAISIADDAKAVAKQSLTHDLNEWAANEAHAIQQTVLEPSVTQLEKLTVMTNERVGAEIKRLNAARETMRSELNGNAGIIEQFSGMYDMVAGVVRTTLPSRAWYVRVAKGGFVEACLDEVTFKEISTGVQMTLPIKLRIRLFYDAANRRWDHADYVESQHADFDTESGLHLHMRIPESLSYGRKYWASAFPEHADKVNAAINAGGFRGGEGWVGLPHPVIFCFGDAAPAEAVSSDLMDFLKRMKLYLFAVNRVLLSVLGAGGRHWDGDMAKMLAYGYGTSPLSFAEMCAKFNFSRQTAEAILESAQAYKNHVAAKTGIVVQGAPVQVAAAPVPEVVAGAPIVG